LAERSVDPLVSKRGATCEGTGSGGLTVVVGVGLQDALLVPQHVQLELDVGTILFGQKRRQLSLDVGLLIQKLPNGKVEGRFGDGRWLGRH
jgi:hypothetical protein